MEWVDQKILEFMFKKDPNAFHGDAEILEGLKSSGEDLRALMIEGVQDVQDRLDLLAEEDYVNLSKTFGPSYAAMLTPKARVELRHLGVSKEG